MPRGISIVACCVVVAVATSGLSQDVIQPKQDQCIACHGNADVWEKDTQHLFVAPDSLAGDVHWKKGISCQDCHGGNGETTKVREAHATDDGFRPLKTAAEKAQLCARCHSDAKYMLPRQPKARLDVVEKFLSSVHAPPPAKPDGDGAAPPLAEAPGSRVASCSSCHPKHAIRAASDPEASTHPRHLAETCGACHKQPMTDLLAGAHKQGGPKDAQGAGTLLSCTACHAGDVHAMPPAKDQRSPVFLDHQIRNCGECHKKEFDQYEVSAHGQALHRLGLSVTAACSNCHGAHAIFPAKDARSKLNMDNVASTCAACHRFIAERLERSVHGRGPLAAAPSRAILPRAIVAVKPGQGKPSCTSCHQGHDLPRPDSVAFRSNSADRCGACHEALMSRYKMSMHGQLASLGFGPAARCSDCHSAHEILPSTNPKAQLSTENRLHTCQQCHSRATLKFASFDPHADHHDGQNYPLLHLVYRFMEILLASVFTFFGIHTLLWLIRSIVHAVRHGRAQRLMPKQKAILRFSPIHRWLHAAVIVSFLGLALTGLPLKFSDRTWAKDLATLMGGFHNTAFWHHLCAMITFGYFTVHLVWVSKQIAASRRSGRSWTAILFGPDSMVPNWRDLRDVGRMFRWFFGLGPKPVFERWTYWEKFDYWAVFWGVGIIGASGLLLWFPEFFCLILPGQILNVAKVIHSEEALLATGFIFTIHFFNTHLRADKFPMDMSMLSGYVSEEEMAEERPEFLERMRREGQLEAIRQDAPSSRRLVILQIWGTVALAIGLGLLVAIVASMFF